MKKVLIFLFICPVICLASSNLSKYPYLAGKHRFGEVNIFKLSPSFVGNIIPKGGLFSYETGAGIEKWSFNFSIKYLSKIDSADFTREIEEHIKFEVQPRYYVMDFLNGLYFSPIIGIYNTGDVSGGALFGFQYFLSNSFVIDGFAGIQSATPVENISFQFFLRYGLSVGIALYK